MPSILLRYGIISTLIINTQIWHVYNSTIREFLQLSPEALLGRFVNNYHGAALTTTNEAWANEIHIMQEVLQPWMDEDGQVIFEYDIPRLGKRIDVVLLLRGLIFCLEFKVGERDMLQSNIEQVLDYALDLKNFHLLSQTGSLSRFSCLLDSEQVQASLFPRYTMIPYTTHW